MSTYKALTLALMALTSAPVLARITTFDSCTSVSYDALKAANAPGEYPSLGPKGLYSTNADGACIYVDASPSSAFATAHTVEYAALLDVVAKLNDSSDLITSNLEFLAGSGGLTLRGAASNTLKARDAGCGEICKSDWTTDQNCNCGSCQYSTTVCSGGLGQFAFCVAYYRCK